MLRDGVSQGTVNVKDIDHSELVRMIVGDDTLRRPRRGGVFGRARRGRADPSAICA